jgi:hypothetical protein
MRPRVKQKDEWNLLIGFLRRGRDGCPAPLIVSVVVNEVNAQAGGSNNQPQAISQQGTRRSRRGQTASGEVRLRWSRTRNKSGGVNFTRSLLPNAALILERQERRGHLRGSERPTTRRPPFEDQDSAWRSFQNTPAARSGRSPSARLPQTSTGTLNPKTCCWTNRCAPLARQIPRTGASLIPGDQSNAFTSFTTSLSDSARRANQAFGLGSRPFPMFRPFAYRFNRPRNAEAIQDPRLLRRLRSVSLAAMEDTLLALLQR